MKTSILERKINENPLAWGTPEMIRLAKKRLKAGLPAALPASSNTATASKAPVNVSPSKNSPSINPSKTELAKTMVAPSKTSCYPEIRAKYDLLIENVMASKSIGQRDKKARIKNLELRYENEIQEKRYQKYTLWCLAGFLSITASLLYAKLALI